MCEVVHTSEINTHIKTIYNQCFDNRDVFVARNKDHFLPEELHGRTAMD
jgi:hypothetical protein